MKNTIEPKFDLTTLPKDDQQVWIQLESTEEWIRARFNIEECGFFDKDGRFIQAAHIYLWCTLEDMNREPDSNEDNRYKVIGGELCMNCGRRHKICWKAPSPLWDAVIEEDGRICIDCFDAIAAAHGYALSWECKSHPIYKGKND